MAVVNCHGQRIEEGRLDAHPGIVMMQGVTVYYRLAAPSLSMSVQA